VAGAEEAVVIALMGDRDAAEVGADADDDQPLVVTLLDPGLVGLRIRKARDRHAAGLFDLFLGAVHDVDRLAPPEHLDVLPRGNRRQIDFDRRAGRDSRCVRIHLGNERPERGHSADGGGASRCNKEKITACRMLRRRRCRHDHNPFQAAAGGTAPGNAQTDQGRLPAPTSPAAAERPLFPANRAEQAVQNRSIGTLAGIAQARYRLPSVQCTNSAQSVDLFRNFMGTRRAGTEMQIALFQPDIPQNTGTILRLCACLDVAAHIIEPAGFPVSDRHFRRAGMDYLDQVTITRHDSWPKFEQWRSDGGYRLILFTTKGIDSYLDHRYGAADILLFGRESAGVPDEVVAAADARLVIPIKPGLRSLNIAMAAAMALGEALRQTGPGIEESMR